MKKNIILFNLFWFCLHVLSQEPVKLNVTYEFRYIRDLENKETPYKSDMVLSIGKNSSRYCSEKLFNENDKKTIQARKLEQERLGNSPSGSMPVVMGGPLLSVGKYGAVINEEVIKNFPKQKLMIEAKLGLRLYHVESDLPKIHWSLLPQTKKVGSYDCQKAACSFGGRTYEAWFTTQIPYQDGPWKLQGLPGLILEARDATNEVSFTLKEISRNQDFEENTQSFLYSQYSIKTNQKDLNKAKKAFETDPEGVMSAQAPNARIMIKNIDNPVDKTVVKIKKYNPMEL